MSKSSSVNERNPQTLSHSSKEPSNDKTQVSQSKEATTESGSFSDMTEDMQQKAIEMTNVAIHKYVRDTSKGQRKPEERAEMEREIERGMMKEIAEHIKKGFDAISEGSGEGTWHCVFGRNFGSFVSYEKHMFIHMTVDDAHIMLWKHG